MKINQQKQVVISAAAVALIIFIKSLLPLVINLRAFRLPNAARMYEILDSLKYLLVFWTGVLTRLYAVKRTSVVSTVRGFRSLVFNGLNDFTHPGPVLTHITTKN
ncbi:hypothetical protein FAM09_20705 [Niastella caeni]|uniref:Uncharacterized protein n=1 Tax=Niastella caeni TaxID=2569763 RepID=A0A4S8HMZ2_9BACT|nr:hypothetical protein [Niastella caeni]THU35819.1 hypothetical protein FAM09_20705 [Niastella caeni]